MAVVNTKIPDAAAQVKRDLEKVHGRFTWEDVIREGLLSIKQRNTAKKPEMDVATSHVEEEQRQVDEALQTPRDKRENLNTGIMELHVQRDIHEYNLFNRVKRMWEAVAFEEVPEGEIFRIVENGKVQKVGGHKYMSLVPGPPYRNREGDLCMRVVGRKMTF